jgi:putative hydrolase of the HAD superfamily
VLSKLGLEDCFEGIVCFETLNPTHKSTVSDDEDDIEFVGSRPTAAATSSQIFDIIGHFAQPILVSGLPKSPIVCKPSEAAIEQALKVANIDPQRTVRALFQTKNKNIIKTFYWHICLPFMFLLFQLFFEDSVRNIQAGKRVGLQTVLVSSWNILCHKYGSLVAKKKKTKAWISSCGSSTTAGRHFPES